MASVQGSVRIWLATKPNILDALAQGVVNHSSLARHAQAEVGGSFEAVKKALIRTTDEVRRERRERQRRVEALLRTSRFEATGNVAVVLSDEEPEVASLARVRTPHGWTAVALEGELARHGGEQGWRSVRHGQCLFSLTSGLELEETPFVLSHVLAALEREGINLTEFVSCREDTLFVVDSADGPAAHRVLASLIGGKGG